MTDAQQWVRYRVTNRMEDSAKQLHGTILTELVLVNSQININKQYDNDHPNTTDSVAWRNVRNQIEDRLQKTMELWRSREIALFEYMDWSMYE